MSRCAASQAMLLLQAPTGKPNSCCCCRESCASSLAVPLLEAPASRLDSYRAGCCRLLPGRLLLL